MALATHTFATYSHCMNQREVVKRLRAEGWKELKGKRGRGSHKMMEGPDGAKVVIPYGEIRPGTLKNIERTTQVTLMK